MAKRAGFLSIAGLIATLFINLAPNLARAATAQPADFYEGKVIHFIVGTSAGQDYDLWARLIGKYLVKYIPGHPTLVVQNMPGAGHIIATNYLFNIAPKDGTVIGMVSRNMPTAAITKQPNVHFDPARFNWLGSPEINHRVMFVGASTQIKSLKDLSTDELIVGTPGGAQGVAAAPILLKNLLGLKLKIVDGYKSPNAVALAVLRGEVGGFVNSVGGPDGARRHWVESAQMRILFNMEPEKVAWLDAPTIFDLVKTDRQRQVLTFFAANTMLGRPLMAPPDVPAERVAILRHAFDETMKDAAFLKEARGMGFEVSPQTGAQIAARVTESMSTPQSIIDEVAQASHLH